MVEEVQVFFFHLSHSGNAPDQCLTPPTWYQRRSTKKLNLLFFLQSKQNKEAREKDHLYSNHLFRSSPSSKSLTSIYTTKELILPSLIHFHKSVPTGLIRGLQPLVYVLFSYWHPPSINHHLRLKISTIFPKECFIETIERSSIKIIHAE